MVSPVTAALRGGGDHLGRGQLGIHETTGNKTVFYNSAGGSKNKEEVLGVVTMSLP